MDTNVTISLTKTQIDNLIEFFDICFIDSIRNDGDLDNMDYLCNMMDIYNKLKTLEKGNANEN